MRGDSDDTKVARNAILIAVVWCLILVSGIMAGQGWVIGWCAGFVSSLALLGLSLYKDWWPSR